MALNDPVTIEGVVHRSVPFTLSKDTDGNIVLSIGGKAAMFFKESSTEVGKFVGTRIEIGASDQNIAVNSDNKILIV